MSDHAFVNEHEYKLAFQQQLLTLLIHKYEASKSFTSGEPSKQKPRIAVKNSPFQADYEDEMDFRKKDWIHDVIARLSEKGIVTVKWEKFQEGRQLAKVYLEPDQAAAAYELAGITPRDQKMARLRRILSPLAGHPWAWVAKWAETAVQLLSERKSAGLDLNDLNGYEQMVSVLLELPKLEDDIPKRVLSQRLFQDTKVFERNVERRLVYLIQTCSGMEYETDADALESVGIADHPRTVLISGCCRCSLDGGETVSLDLFRGGVGLSRDTVRMLEIAEIPAERIILIENLTSWHQWVLERREENEIVIFTGGFPNRTVQELLQKIGDYLRGGGRMPPVYHWGDMDAGGIRIFEFIRGNFFPELIPLWMDEPSFLRYADSGMEISRSYENKLREMLADGRFVRWRGLLQLMLTHGKRIEQESMVIPLKEFEDLR